MRVLLLNYCFHYLLIKSDTPWSWSSTARSIEFFRIGTPAPRKTLQFRLRIPDRPVVAFHSHHPCNGWIAITKRFQCRRHGRTRKSWTHPIIN